MTLQTKHNQQVGQSVLEVRASYSSSKYIVLSKSSESIYNRLNLSNDDLTSFILVSQKTTWPDLIRFSIPEDNTLLDSIRFAEYVDNSVREITPLYTAEEKNKSWLPPGNCFWDGEQYCSEPSKTMIKDYLQCVTYTYCNQLPLQWQPSNKSK